MACLQRLDIKQPPGSMVTTEEKALEHVELADLKKHALDLC